MSKPASKVRAYLATFPETADVIDSVLGGKPQPISGAELVTEHFNPMIDWIFERIAEEVEADHLDGDEALLFIEELSVFARYNSQFLHRAATSVEGACFELAHEFRRNHLEEGGERGRLPAHFALYSGALLSDLNVRVNGHVPRPETTTLLVLHDLLVESHCASTICGGYYATEGVAINETVLLRRITSQYGRLAVGVDAPLPALDYYYSLHLDDEHDAATGDTSVEQGHMDGIARFVRDHELFNLQLRQICDGFLQILEGMAYWWTELALRCNGGD